MDAPLTIVPDIEEAAADFAELRRLSGRFGFDLAGTLDSLADSGTPVWAAQVDEVAAPSTGHLVCRYKLAERLQGVLAALRVVARNCEGDLVEKIVCQDTPPIEVTPEMIEAGVREFRGFHYDFDDEKETVARIWSAMWEAHS